MNLNKPSCFATICTSNCKQELIGFILSLSIYHKNELVYIMCDEDTKINYDNMSFKPELKIKWFIELDKYTKYNRQEMEILNIWSEFQMSKSIILDYALKENNDCLFLDSDIILTEQINDINTKYSLGVCPGFINKETYEKYGYYNGGMLWVKDKEIPQKWREYTKTSRYFDQASIEDLYNEYKKTDDVFVFDDNYNLQSWRFIVGEEPGNVIASYLKTDITRNILLYKNKPLKFIHTHFNKPEFQQLNMFFITKLKEAKMYKVLLSIYRCIYNKWIISIPKQPMKGLGFHKNDSFREIPVLLRNKHSDIDVQFHTNSIHCKILPDIILYDRPTLEWINEELFNSSLILLGNGDIKKEGNKIKSIKNDTNVIPWIFWPRKPILVEKIIRNNSIKTYSERKIISIFIGNYENSVQQKYRTNINWSDIIEEFHCTSGQKHLFTHEEYLNKLGNSKYGLCLRGYGSKCHREVELMAMGTVPIITKDVCMDSYMNPPLEDIHYIKVNKPEEINEKINNINEDDWEKMSNRCISWYQQNVLSSNMWNNMMNYIYYK